MSQAKRKRKTGEYDNYLTFEEQQSSFDQTDKLSNQAKVSQELGWPDREIWERMPAEKLARGLGIFSFGLGVVELFAPKLVARIAGAKGKTPGLVRLFGVREIMSGVLIFSQGKRPDMGVWSRVLGDLIDLAALGLIFLRPKTNKIGTLFALVNVLAITKLDIMTAKELSRLKGAITEDGMIRVQKSVFINRSPQEVYERWRHLDELPTFMRHLVSVTAEDKRQMHWRATAPGGSTVEWDAEIVEDRPGELISWRSLPGAEVCNSGAVRFEPVPPERGTILHVELEYSPPAGIIGAQVARLFREEPSQQLKDDLYRFKQIAETGEIIRSDASPEGNGSILQRPAQPLPG
jgi:uncharacterized membrane protein